MGKKKKKARDVEKAYSRKQHVHKLERLVKALQAGKPFRIQVAGERIYVPVDAVFNIEHEREGKDEELEFQLKWRND
ncbi:MAG: amphi-Trp domain-containing protein [Pseudomonadota bacterium]